MRRYQKRLLILFGSIGGFFVLLFILFNIFVLNLFEGSVKSILELVPKEMVFFVQTHATGNALEDLPRSDFVRKMRDSRSVSAFFASETWQGVDGEFSVTENLTRVDEMREKLPIDVFESFLGDDLYVAGRPTSDDPQRWDYVIYTRIDAIIKIGVDFCDLPLVRKRMDPSIRIERIPSQRYRELAVDRDGKLHRSYFARIKDVLVITNKEPLMQSVMHLVDAGSARSLEFDKAFERASVPVAKESSQVAAFVNLTRLWESLGITGWMESPSLPGQARILLKLIGADRMYLGTGLCDFVESPSARWEFLLDENYEFEHEYRIFNAEPAPVADALDRYRRFLPESCFFFGFLKCPPKDLFTLMATQVTQNNRELVDERLASKPRYQDFNDFLLQTGANFGEMLAVTLSRIHYDVLPYRPNPAVNLFFEVADQGQLESFLDYLTEDEFALEDLSREEYQGITIVRGYQKIPVVEWAKELAYMTIDNTFVLSTSMPFLKEVVDVYHQQSASLVDSDRFRSQVEILPKRCNLFAYWDADRAAEWFRDYKEYIAVINSRFPDSRWGEARMQAQQKVASTHSRNLDRDEMEALVEEELVTMSREYEATERARWQEILAERISWGRFLATGIIGATFAKDRVQTVLQAAFDFE